MLNNLKLLLGIDENDTSRDQVLNLIIANTLTRLKILLGGIEPPEELDHIVVDVAIIRFNKIGSEGLSDHTVEGETMKFVDDDFAGYSEEIQAYLATQNQTTRGKLRFL
jgi:hypothetical protein